MDVCVKRRDRCRQETISPSSPSEGRYLLFIHQSTLFKEVANVSQLILEWREVSNRDLLLLDICIDGGILEIPINAEFKEYPE